MYGVMNVHDLPNNVWRLLRTSDACATGKAYQNDSLCFFYERQCGPHLAVGTPAGLCAASKDGSILASGHVHEIAQAASFAKGYDEVGTSWRPDKTGLVLEVLLRT